MTIIPTTADLFNALIRNGKVDVVLQDQTSGIVNVYLSQKLKEDITLASDTDLNDEAITVSSGHGFVAGSWIELYEGERFSQMEVLSISTNIINLSMPLDYAFTTKATIYRVNINMAVNALDPYIEFTYKPAGTQKKDIVQAILTIYDNSQMDNGTFGGLAKLAKGVFFRKEDGALGTGNLFNVRQNGDTINRAFNHIYDDKAPSGEFGFTVNFKIGGQHEHGVVVRLDPVLNEHICALVRDNLSALTAMYIVMVGSNVVD